MLARSTHAWAERHVIRPRWPTTHRGHASACANGQIHTHTQARAVAGSWRSGDARRPPERICMCVMVHIRVCICVMAAFVWSRWRHDVWPTTPRQHTHPSPYFHPLCTICTATAATEKQHNRKSRRDGQVFDLQVVNALWCVYTL